MVTLLKAANMICATLRNSERLAHAARHGGDEGGPPPGRNGPPRGHHPGSGPGQYNPSIVVSGPPPNSPAPTPAPAPFQQYQQPPPVRCNTIIYYTFIYVYIDMFSFLISREYRAGFIHKHARKGSQNYTYSKAGRSDQSNFRGDVVVSVVYCRQKPRSFSCLQCFVSP